jgi:hypothetical protein
MAVRPDSNAMVDTSTRSANAPRLHPDMKPPNNPCFVVHWLAGDRDWAAACWLTTHYVPSEPSLARLGRLTHSNLSVAFGIYL